MMVEHEAAIRNGQRYMTTVDVETQIDKYEVPCDVFRNVHINFYSIPFIASQIQRLCDVDVYLTNSALMDILEPLVSYELRDSFVDLNRITIDRTANEYELHMLTDKPWFLEMRSFRQSTSYW
ncbi:hypothetical protein ACOME3_008139 [Neoechinorhynchus agilis]